MIVANDLSRLPPADKAAVIYAHAHADVATRLWRAALGSSDDGDPSSAAATCPDFDLESLLSLLAPRSGPTRGPTPGATPAVARILLPSEAPATDATPADPTSATDPAASALAGSVTGPVTGLGPNARFRDTLDAAATRTGIPAAALAAIVDAEAAKGCDGSWKTGSRNPRSSAAGLGQFLSGTWQGEAERAGTWLHDTAARQGWLGEDGRVLPAARSALLALRYDGAASINATADYARRSVAQLQQAGVAVAGDTATIARAAYLGHHLGTGDAIRFLKGGLDGNRARVLLDAQVGSASATQRIARVGDAATAHRSWLLDYVDRHVTPARFAS